MVFQWSLSDSKSPQVSRILLSILADLKNAVVWMVSTCPLISKSSSPCANPLVTVLSVPITIGITVTFMFHSFFSSLAKSRYLSFNCYPIVSWNGKVYYSAGSLFSLLINTRSGHLAEIKRSIYISKPQRISNISFSKTDSGLCIYHLFVWSNLSFLYNS